MASRKKRRARRDRSNPAAGFRRGYAGPFEAPDTTNDLAGEAVALWQKHSPKTLTREDGREIVENLLGFFGLLEEWRFAEQVSAIEKSKKVVRPEVKREEIVPVDHG